MREGRKSVATIYCVNDLGTTKRTRDGVLFFAQMVSGRKASQRMRATLARVAAPDID
jgi:hypothetical protein